jgi:hypothetical protein
VCDRALDGDGALTRLWPLVHAERLPSWLKDYVEMEESASKLRLFETQCVPGLLQTEAYAHAIIAAGRGKVDQEAVDELVTARIARQAIFSRKNPPAVWVIVDESVLHRRICSHNVMNDQLTHLLDIIDPPNLVVQVLPYDACMNVPQVVPFTGMSFADSPDTFYVNTPGGGGNFVISPDAVQRCNVVFDLLRAAAMPPELTVDRLLAAIKET